jgi:hypothetical protein
MAELVKKLDEAKIMDIKVSQSFRGASYWYGERSRQGVVESISVDMGSGNETNRATPRIGIIEVRYTHADFEEGRNALKNLGAERGAILGFDEFGRFNGKAVPIGDSEPRLNTTNAKKIEADLKRLIESNKEVRKAIYEIMEHKDRVFIKGEIKRISSREILKEKDM